MLARGEVLSSATSQTRNSARSIYPEHYWPMGSQAIADDSRRGRGVSSWLGELAYLAMGLAAGAAGLFVTLVTMLIGLLPVAAGAVYVWRRAGTHRWTFLAGLMIGVAVSAVPTLGPALNNTDPAVRYDPSTVPVLIAALVVGALGALLLVASTVRRVAHAAGHPGPHRL